MDKELDEILKKIEEFDLGALLASISEPPIEVLLKELHDSTVKLLENL
jgi:hypothetical protein